MNEIEILINQLKEIRALTDYISEDFQATQRLREIRERVEMALNAIEQIEDIQ